MKRSWHITKETLPMIVAELATDCPKWEKPHILSIKPGRSRSTLFSTRFYGHMGVLRKGLYAVGIEKTELQLKYIILDKALLIEADGGEPYPSETISVRLPEGGITEINYPLMNTSGRTNKEMITAYTALCMIASEYEIALPEKEY